MSTRLFEMRAERAEELKAAEAVLQRAEQEKRDVSAQEKTLIDERLARVKALNPKIESIESRNTLLGFDPVAMLSGRLVKPGEPDAHDEDRPSGLITPKEHPMALALKRNFGTWARRAVGSLTGLPNLTEQQPGMEASSPSGVVISEGSGTGLDSMSFITPFQVLPFLRSYFGFAPFEQAGASVISTDHMREINVPVVAAGALPTQYPEGQGPAQGPSGSQPFGMSGFQMGANKLSRQVIASWESLQSTEIPLQPMIVDELLAAIANGLTSAATTQMYAALSGASSTLQISGSGVENDNYGLMTALRHALVEGFEGPECCWMLSRNTLAIIRNTRASTSGVVMFDPDNDTILGRRYVTNEYFDSICGSGFVAYGNWNRGAWLRRTPIITRILQELYWLNSEIGFLATAWGDNHFLAELVSAAQPPTWQPLYYCVLPSGSQS